MRILLYVGVGVIAIIVFYFIFLSLSSRKQPESGLVKGQLRACPATPNCVCSERNTDIAFIEPLIYNTSADEAWRLARQSVVEAGGVILSEHDGYFHASFVSPLMRYIDDVELRIDDENKVIHIRSASRTGHSDFGANRKRVSAIRKLFTLKTLQKE